MHREFTAQLIFKSGRQDLLPRYFADDAFWQNISQDIKRLKPIKSSIFDLL